MCLDVPWPEDQEKSDLMKECLTQANVQVLSDESVGIQPKNENWVIWEVS